MTIKSPPLGTIRNFETAQPFGGKNRPLSDCANELRWPCAKQKFANLRTYSICADYDVSVHANPIVEGKLDAIIIFFQLNQPVVEEQSLVCDGLLDHRVQISAMYIDAR